MERAFLASQQRLYTPVTDTEALDLVTPIAACLSLVPEFSLATYLGRMQQAELMERKLVRNPATGR